MYPSVTSVVARDDYVLTVGFDNQEYGSLDMKPFLDFGIFHRLKDPVIFNQVHVAFDTLEWDAVIDLDPEFVYSKCRIRRDA